MSMQDRLAALGIGYAPPVQETVDRDTYRTPEDWLELVRKVDPTGRIFLDPCTNDENSTNAEHFITKKTARDVSQWPLPPPGRLVFQQHPYSDNLTWADNCIAYVDKMFEHGCDGQYIVLANASAGTKWFDKLTSRCTAVCFPDKRIAFRHPNPPHDKVTGNQWGTGIWYFGDYLTEFINAFDAVGTIVIPQQSLATIPNVTQLHKRLCRMEPDVVRVIAELMVRLEKGREIYGAYNMATDCRDMNKEAREEFLDMLFYIVARDLKEQKINDDNTRF